MKLAAFEGQPVKGVYFFPGERGENAWMYTAHLAASSIFTMGGSIGIPAILVAGSLASD